MRERRVLYELPAGPERDLVLVAGDLFPVTDSSMRACSIATTLSVGVLLSAGKVWPQMIVDGRPSIVLENAVARAVVDIGGGAIADFHLREAPLNPLSWREEGEPTAPRWMGHFVCLDRWGAPGEGEARNGMPFHGEASKVDWQILSGPGQRGGVVEVEMSATLPLAGLKIHRHMAMGSKTAYIAVRETVTNRNRLGRLYNMVQHPTVGQPFLVETALVDCNGRKGFMDSSPLPNPEEPAVYWPQALKDGLPLNMRRFPDPGHPDRAPDSGTVHDVVSYVIEDEYGWITASSPEKRLLIGYVWRTEDYPWVIEWRHLENGVSGRHRPGIRHHGSASTAGGPGGETRDIRSPTVRLPGHR